jgi:aspartyl protease family protein
VQTANGVVRAAKARIPELRLQGIVVRDVEATVMPPGALNITLLGMSFLKQLKSFEMNGNTLILKQ